MVNLQDNSVRNLGVTYIQAPQPKTHISCSTLLLHCVPSHRYRRMMASHLECQKKAMRAAQQVCYVTVMVLALMLILCNVVQVTASAFNRSP